MILKMNFNFNIKDMPEAAGPSIRCVTNVRDRHHMGKWGIKRGSQCGQLVEWRFLTLTRHDRRRWTTASTRLSTRSAANQSGSRRYFDVTQIVPHHLRPCAFAQPIAGVHDAEASKIPFIGPIGRVRISAKAVCQHSWAKPISDAYARHLLTPVLSLRSPQRRDGNFISPP